MHVAQFTPSHTPATCQWEQLDSGLPCTMTKRQIHTIYIGANFVVFLMWRESMTNKMSFEWMHEHFTVSRGNLSEVVTVLICLTGPNQSRFFSVWVEIPHRDQVWTGPLIHDGRVFTCFIRLSETFSGSMVDANHRRFLSNGGRTFTR